MIKADAPLFANVLPNIASIAGVRARLDCVFADFRGEQKPGIRKHAEKCIQKLQEPLRKVLADDEVALGAFRCLPPLSGLEQYFLSWAVTYSHATVLVITNKRLLHFGVLSNGDWRKNCRELSWDAIGEARVKVWPAEPRAAIAPGRWQPATLLAHAPGGCQKAARASAVVFPGGYVAPDRCIAGLEVAVPGMF